jgi:restriction system protein
LHKCLKDWNATIEALGQGKQVILIRNYKTSINRFLLYPLVNYALKDYYLDRFQEIHQGFVAKNVLPEKKDDKILIKYYATLEDILERPLSRIPSEKYYIWTRDHIKDYLTGKTAFIWALRVYILQEPIWAERTPGALRYANLKEKVTLEGMKPVLSGNEFANVFIEI